MFIGSIELATETNLRVPVQSKLLLTTIIEDRTFVSFY